MAPCRRPRTLASPWGTFCITFLNYVSLHTARKTFSAVKPALIGLEFFQGISSTTGATQHKQDAMSGIVDASFLSMYAVGLFFSGWFADRHDARRVLVVASLGSAACVCGFALGGALGLRNVAFYAALWGLHGLAQSLAYPASVKALVSWFPAGPGSRRGFVLGLWGASSALGNILGGGVAAMAQRLVPAPSAYWKVTLLVAGGMLVVVGLGVVGVFLFSRPPPPLKDQQGRQQDDRAVSLLSVSENANVNVNARQSRRRAPTPVAFSRACCLPGVVPYALAFAATKATLYSFLFWLPFFLTTAYGLSSSTANLDAMVYDIGSLIGGTATGLLLDHCLGVRRQGAEGAGHDPGAEEASAEEEARRREQGRRTYGSIAIAGLLLACGPIAALAGTSTGSTGGRSGLGLVAAVLLALASGTLLGGPIVILAGIAAADLGEHATLRHQGQGAVATVSGIVDGTGSIGAAVAQVLVGALTDCVHVAKGACKDPHLQQHGNGTMACGGAGEPGAVCMQTKGCQACNWPPVFFMMIAANVVACLAVGVHMGVARWRRQRRDCRRRR